MKSTIWNLQFGVCSLKSQNQAKNGCLRQFKAVGECLSHVCTILMCVFLPFQWSKPDLSTMSESEVIPPQRSRISGGKAMAQFCAAWFCWNLEGRWPVVFSVNVWSLVAIGQSICKCDGPEGISGAADGGQTVAPMRSGFGRELRLAVHQLPSKFEENPRRGSLAVVFRRLEVFFAVWNLKSAVLAVSPILAVFAVSWVSAVFSCKKQLYKRLCPSVGPWVGLLVTRFSKTANSRKFKKNPLNSSKFPFFPFFPETMAATSMIHTSFGSYFHGKF